MKRALFSSLIVLLLFVFHPSVSALNETDGFLFTDTTVTDSSSFSAEISFSGDIEAAYMEFTLILPDGISLRSTDPPEDLKNYCDLIGKNGEYRFVLSSEEGIDFEGGRKLIKLFMIADKNLPDGDYKVRTENIRVVDTDGNTYSPVFSGGQIKVRRNTAAATPETDKVCRHSFDGWTVISQPDYDNEGKRVKVCRICGEICKTLVIPAVPRYSIADTEISFGRNHTYIGKAVKPELSVSYKGIALENGTDYTVSYENNKSAGTGKITVKGTGAFEGKMTLSFSIKPKASSLTKVSTLKNGRVKIKWKKVSACDGYRIYVRVPGEDEYKVLKTVKKSSVTSYSTSKLKADGKYRFKIRTYVSDGENRVFSSYSKIKVFRL